MLQLCQNDKKERVEQVKVNWALIGPWALSKLMNWAFGLEF